MATLNDLLTEIEMMMDVPDDDLNDDQKLAMEAYLQELGEAEADKVDKFASFVKEQTNRAKAIREESTRLSNRARAIENKIANLKEYYLFSMNQHDKEKISGNVYTISLRKSHRVKVDESALHTLQLEYVTQTIEPRKAEIKKALEAGKQLDGCSLVETTSLSIR